MTKILGAALLLASGFACKSNSHKKNEELVMRTSYGDSYAKSTERYLASKADAAGTTVTPMDQAKGSKADLEMTRKIRQTITDDSSLSMKAQNVKIVTLQGLTTLRGSVDTSKEKIKIEQLARRVGAKKISNQLELTIQ